MDPPLNQVGASSAVIDTRSTSARQTEFVLSLPSSFSVSAVNRARVIVSTGHHRPIFPAERWVTLVDLNNSYVHHAASLVRQRTGAAPRQEVSVGRYGHQSRTPTAPLRGRPRRSLTAALHYPVLRVSGSWVERCRAHTRHSP